MPLSTPPVIAVLSALMLPTATRKTGLQPSQAAKAKSTIIIYKQILRQLRRLESSARERSRPFHYDIELVMVVIALWLVA
jgi:hypothetical protein